MSSITNNGKTVLLKGDIPPAGDTAPDFTYVTDSMAEASLYDITDPVKVILAMPSLDTGTCSREMIRFDKELEGKEGVYALCMTMDLPFAMKRFCTTENVTNVHVGSDYRYKDFLGEFNVEMLDGALKGLACRAVFVIDDKNEVQYSELVADLGSEPDYEAALSVVDRLAGK